MIIKSSAYALSSVDPLAVPELVLPEIAMVGRSNVGKSSLINKVINRKNLARTSQAPGKTQTINYYLINKLFYLVDLPGYGYAQVPQKTREQWRKWIFNYVQNGSQLRGVIQLIDVRHEPSVLDVEMYRYLDTCQVPYQVVATKLDKIKRSQYQKQLKLVRQTLQMPQQQPLVAFSALTGDGKEDVLAFLDFCLQLDAEDEQLTAE